MKLALVTDTHLSPRDGLLARNWAAVDSWIASSGADAVVHLGDITADGERDPSAFAHARELICRPDRDVLFLPGNHDIGDGPAEHGPPRAPSPQRLADYRRTFGPDWWSLRVSGWQLIGLDAQLFGAGGEEEARQWDWLEGAVRGGEDRLGLFSHKPLVPFGPAGPDAPTRYPPAAARARLMTLLGRRDLRFIASGHTHQALSFRQGRVEHCWVPSTAFVIPDPLQALVGEKRLGALLLELGPDGHAFTRAEPPGLAAHDLLDLAHLYPEVARMRPPDRPET